MDNARVVHTLSKESLTGDAAKKFSAVQLEATESIRVITWDTDGNKSRVSRAVITEALGYDPVEKLLEGEYGEFKYADKVIDDLQVAYDGLRASVAQLTTDLKNANEENKRLDRKYKSLETKHKNQERRLVALESAAVNPIATDVSDDETHTATVSEPATEGETERSTTGKDTEAGTSDTTDRESVVERSAVDHSSSDTDADEVRRTTTVTRESAPAAVNETAVEDSETAATPVVETTTTEVETTPPSESSTWDRFKGRLYGTQTSILYRKVPTREYVRDEHGDLIVDDYGNPEVVEKDRPTTLAAFLGGAAVVGVLWYLYGRHGVDHSVITNGQSDTIIHNQNTIMHNQDILKSEYAHISGILDPNGPKHPGNVFNPDPSVPGNVFTHINDKLNHLLQIEKAENHRGFRSFFNGHGGGFRVFGTHIERLHAAVNGVHDTIWAHAEKLVKGEARVRKVTQWILNHNGVKWNGGGPGVDAHQLPVGFSFRVPNINS